MRLVQGDTLPLTCLWCRSSGCCVQYGLHCPQYCWTFVLPVSPILFNFDGWRVHLRIHNRILSAVPYFVWTRKCDTSVWSNSNTTLYYGRLGLNYVLWVWKIYWCNPKAVQMSPLGQRRLRCTRFLKTISNNGVHSGLFVGCACWKFHFIFFTKSETELGS